MTHKVHQIDIHFEGESEDFFRSLMARWESIFMSRLEKSTDSVLTKFENRQYQVELSVLEIDLENLHPEDFENQFFRKYEAQLEQELLAHLYGEQGNTVQRTSIQQSQSELLFYFLLHGTLPWQFTGTITDINSLFLEVAAKEAGALRQFLQTYGHYTSLQQRLVFQFSEAVLAEGIKILSPGDSTFIISYVHQVQNKYRFLKNPQISKTPYEKTVWQVVYSYLLTNRSSFFNKKSFLKQTIGQLANRYAITYSKLLQWVTIETHHRLPAELLALLTALKNEEQAPFNKQIPSWKNIYLLFTKISNSAKSVENLTLQRELLIQILSANNNYLYLQQINESQTLQLVYALRPVQYPFIKKYTKELDKHKDCGMLQGKAGNNFRLVKWQIIFPILLKNSDSSFNRKHFVWQVLNKIAAHYNLKVLYIVNYLANHLLLKEDRELYKIFQVLQHQYIPEKQTMVSKPVITAEYIKNQLRKGNDLEDNPLLWKKYLLTATAETNFWYLLTETEHRALVQFLYPDKSTFVLSYSEAIDDQKNIGTFQGKVSGNVTSIKWQFIHSVLLQPNQQVFNKQYFVYSVLQKIAAHYNLKTEELISYFYVNVKKQGFGVPYELVEIIKRLYNNAQQRNKKIHSTGKDTQVVSKPSNKIQKAKYLLEEYLGTEAALSSLITLLSHEYEFVFFIKHLLKVTALLHMMLETQLAINLNKKRLLVVLLRISRQYKEMSKAAITHALINFIFKELKTQEQISAFNAYLERLSTSEPLLKQASLFKEHFQPEENSMPMLKEIVPEDENLNGIFLNNAGLVLLAPFFPRLFMLAGLTENGVFKDRDHTIQAIFIMQYALFGTTDFPEFELVLNKIITGCKSGKPLPRCVDLTPEQKTITDGMLQGVIQHWSKIKTIEGLREGFLQREGKLEETDENYILTIEAKAFDMLLDSIPWNYKTVKFSWMLKPMIVNWR